MRLLVPCALILVTLAGCSDDGPSEAPRDGLTAADGTPMVEQVLRWGEQERTVVGNYTGTFQQQEQTSFGPAGTATIKTHDLSSLLEAGAPNFVTAQVTPDDGSIVIWASTDDFADIWTYDCLCPGFAGTAFEATVVPAGTVTLNVAFVGNSATGTAPADLAGLGYTVQVTATRAPERLLSGIAVEVDMPVPGTTVTFEGLDGDVPDVLVYAPDDTYVGTLDRGATVDTTLGSNGTTGGYVFMMSGHGAAAKVAVTLPEGERADNRVLTQAIATDGPQTVTPGQAQKVTDTAPLHPLQAGACLASTTLVVDPDLGLAGPAGSLGSLTGFGLQPLGYGGCIFTTMGDPSLEAGDYTATYSDTQDEGQTTVQLFLMGFGR